jgi:WD40 repeat protein
LIINTLRGYGGKAYQVIMWKILTFTLWLMIGLVGVIFVRLPPRSWQCYRSPQSPIQPIINNHSGKLLLASANGDVEVWTVDGFPLTHFFTAPLLKSIAFSADGEMILTGHFDATARLWNTTSGQQLNILGNHEGPISHVAFSPDDSTVLTGSTDGAVRIWDTQTGQQITSLVDSNEGQYRRDFATDGQSVFTSQLSFRDGSLIINQWDVKSGGLLHSLSLGPAFRSGYKLTTDNIGVMTGTSISINLWDIPSGQLVRAFRSGDYSSDASIIIAPDSKTMLVTRRDARHDELWDIQTGTLLHIIPTTTGAINAHAFSTDNKTFVLGSLDGFLEVHDIASGELIRKIRVNPDERESHLWLGYLPDGKTLLVKQIGRDEPVTLWDTQSGELIRPLCPLVLGRRWIVAGGGLCMLAFAAVARFVRQVMNAPVPTRKDLSL